ncbi:MAG TPA: class I SAM-dependent methyltransferase [Kamptonema sp.]|nr:class I SAM-dependent methyltransferase [Kamptonema sp.]
MSQARNYWETTPSAGVASQWVSNPIIEEAINKRMSGGDTQKYWLAWLIEDFFCCQKFERLLSIGCGIGNHEVIIAKLGLAKHIDAFDFSDASLEIARKNADLAGVNINFYQDDFNNFKLSEEHKYDIVFCSGSMHHVKEIERFISIVHQALKPEGYLIVNEYVGDCYNIYSQPQVDLINRLYNCFPDELKSGKMETFVNPTLKQVFEADPSEAVRSKLIIPLLDEYFVREVFNPLGGAILHPMYPLLDHNQFLPGDAKGEAIIRLLLEFEEILMELPGGLPTDFCLSILRPKDI